MTASSRRSAFTLTELLVVIGIVALLAAILLPVLASARSSGRQTQCLSNQRQLGAALLLYTQDNDGRFPRGVAQYDPDFWDVLLLPYLKSRDVYCCPATITPHIYEEMNPPVWPEHIARGYALNSYLSEADKKTAPGVFLSRVSYPATTIAFCEVSYLTNSDGSYSRRPTLHHPDDAQSLIPDRFPPHVTHGFVGGPGATRHRGGSHYTFVDGHIKWYPPAQVRSGTRNPDGSLPKNDGSAPGFAL